MSANDRPAKHRTAPPASGASRLAGSWLTRRLGGYALAGAGPIAVSGAHFLLSLAMVAAATPAAFGAFTFLMVAMQFGWGLASALVGAPLQVRHRAGRATSSGEALLAAGLCGSAAGGLSLALIGAALALAPVAVALAAAAGTLGLLRWIARAWNYADGRAAVVARSDLAYAMTLLLMLATARLLGVDGATAGYAALAFAAGCGLVMAGAPFLRQQFRRPTCAALRRYRAIWRGQSRWALLGVVSTEASANAHAYLVTLVFGPAAFAPIAAGALLVRPLNLAQTALADFERPRLARMDDRERRSALRLFRIVLLAIWVAAALGAIVLFATWLRGLIPAGYDAGTLAVAVALWLGVAGAILLYVPESVLLQARGAFRPLAVANLWAGAGSIVGVAAMLLLAPPVWSIAGLAIGAAVNVALIRRAAR